MANEQVQAFGPSSITGDRCHADGFCAPRQRTLRKWPMSVRVGEPVRMVAVRVSRWIRAKTSAAIRSRPRRWEWRAGDRHQPSPDRRPGLYIRAQALATVRSAVQGRSRAPPRACKSFSGRSLQTPQSKRPPRRGWPFSVCGDGRMLRLDTDKRPDSRGTGAFGMKPLAVTYSRMA